MKNFLKYFLMAAISLAFWHAIGAKARAAEVDHLQEAAIALVITQECSIKMDDLINSESVKYGKQMGYSLDRTAREVALVAVGIHIGIMQFTTNKKFCAAMAAEFAKD